MDILPYAQLFKSLALIFSVLAFTWRLRAFYHLARPVDLAPARGQAGRGVLYAYTLGMAPWAKESTRLHWAAYLRGVAFHVGIFLGLGLLVGHSLIGRLPEIVRTSFGVLALAGAVLGLLGLVARFSEPNLKSLSTPDDYFAVLIVSLFLALAGLQLLYPPAQTAFFFIAGLMLLYAPFSKIRHCIYYAYARLFFGRFTGSRGVLPHSQQEVRHG
jgi:nitrate reductase gamma subunit